MTKTKTDGEELSVADDDKSTVSEISEEIMGESSLGGEQQRKSLKLNLDNDAENNDDDASTTSSSSSTDTQILLLSSRNKKVGDDLMNQDAVASPLVPQQATSFANQVDKRENLAAMVEKSLLDKLIDDAIEIHERKSSKMLAEQYKQAVVFGLDQDERDTDEDEDEDVNHLDDHNGRGSSLSPTNHQPFKIHIPSIDLSSGDEDEDDLIKTGVKAPPKPPPVVYNVPVTKEKLTSLVESLVDNYFWQRLDSLKEELVRQENNTEDVSTWSELGDFFQSDLESPTSSEAKEAETTFKRMLFDLVGELFYDLYLERFEAAQIVSSYLPNIKRTAKKNYFKSAMKGPSQKEAAKKMVMDKVY